MKEHIIEELFDCLYEIKNTAELVPQPPKDMGRAEMNVLYSIHLLGQELASVKITDISRKLSIQSPNVIALVKKLEQHDLVRKTADTKDRRVVRVSLTTAGKTLVERYVLAYHERLQQAFNGEEEEIRLLIRQLKKLGRKVEKTKTLFIEELGGEEYE